MEATNPEEEARRERKHMRTRLLTGIVYLLVLLLFYMLKICVNGFLFDFLVLAFGIVGTYEMLRAFRDKTSKIERVLVMTFVVLVMLTFAVSDFIYKAIYHSEIGSGVSNYTPLITFSVFIAGVSVLFGLLVFAHEQVSVQSLGYSLIAYFYPSVFLLVLMGMNHMERYSEVAVLFVFVICPFSDSLALVFGKLFGKKLPAKMAPHVSPNKTLIGGFGGLVGGALGSILVFFVYYGLCRPVMAGDFTSVVFEWNEMIFFVGIGVIAAAFSQFGDLVESAIKRKLGIKDMGNILPAHGGILDRIDSTLYATLIICLIFVARIMLTS